MITRLIAWSATHRLVVLVLAAALAAAGAWSARHAPLDAIPDLSDPQVILATEWMGRSPDLVEDHVTWPLSTAMHGVEGVQAVRGQSMFGMSFIYVLFDDGTATDDARARVSEALALARPRLPDGATARVGPDASGVGWVFQYALVDDTGALGAVGLRTLQDEVVRPALSSVQGVAEVASIGGFVRQVEVSLDPDRMLAHGVSFDEVAGAVARANVVAGGGAIEVAGHELMVRSRGAASSFDDLLDAPIRAVMEPSAAAALGGGAPAAPEMSDMGASPAPAAQPRSAGATEHAIRVRDVADVQWAPAPRRGVADLDGRGETPGGIVVARQGTNALDVLERVKAERDAVARSLPAGVRIVTVYDRSELIEGAIGTVREALVEELIVVCLVILLFLGHFRTALVPVITLPVAVLGAFVPLYLLGVTLNVMSLAGIVVAVGAMVDASILCVENVHSRLARWEADGQPGDRAEVMIRAMQEVGPSAFGSLMVIAVSFIPVFGLEAAEGRLFSPLAWTKTWAMIVAAGLAVTLAPALAVTFVTKRGRTDSEDALSTWLGRVYEPVVRRVVRSRRLVIAASVAALLATVPVALDLEWEFMPPLHEGSLLYMPTAPPGMSEAEAARVLRIMDAKIMEVPEVRSVYGKMGRADTATDPAPLSMAETVIQLAPQSAWRDGMTWDGLIRELDARLAAPGLPNAWWMPVQARTEMLSTGIRSPLGIKVFGPSLEGIEAASVRIERALAGVPGTRSLYAERASGGFYLDVDLRRAEAQALGVSPADVANTLEGALAGRQVGEWLQHRSRAPIVLRYARDFRADPDAIGEALVDRSDGAAVPLSRVANVTHTGGPDMIRSEGGQLVGHVFVDPGARPVASWVTDAEAALTQAGLDRPGALGDGVRWSWAGTYESLERARERLQWLIPLTLVLIIGILRLNTRSWVATAIVVGSLPFSVVGGAWLLWGLDYNLSVAVVVGMIALAGLDAETGVVMLLYLRVAWDGAGGVDGVRSEAALEQVVVDGAARRMRPKLMTVLTDLVGFVPVFVVTGIGSDVMRRIAAPMVGGLFSSFLLELLVYPAIFATWKAAEVRRAQRRRGVEGVTTA